MTLFGFKRQHLTGEKRKLCAATQFAGHTSSSLTKKTKLKLR
jgi:hypothetical protein